MTAAAYILPLATIDEVRAELEDTNRSLLRLGEGIVVDRDQLDQRRSRLLWWRTALEVQLTLMEAEAAS